MKKLMAFALVLLSFGSFATTVNDCQQLSSSSLAAICTSMVRDCKNPIEGSISFKRAATLQKSGDQALEEVMKELLNYEDETWQDYRSFQVTQANAGLTFSWIFERNEEALSPFLSLWMNSGVESYSLSGSFLYGQDSGYVFIDRSTQEAFLYVIGEAN